MRRYADVLKKTVIPKYARTNSDTAPALLAALHRFGSAITSAIGAAVEGVTGGLAGYAVGSLLKKGTSAATDLSAARKVGRSLQGASGMANQPSIRPQVVPLMRGTGLETSQ